jgi:hypothetical protein
MITLWLAAGILTKGSAPAPGFTYPETSITFINTKRIKRRTVMTTIINQGD